MSEQASRRPKRITSCIAVNILAGVLLLLVAISLLGYPGTYTPAGYIGVLLFLLSGSLAISSGVSLYRGRTRLGAVLTGFAVLWTLLLSGILLVTGLHAWALFSLLGGLSLFSFTLLLSRYRASTPQPEMAIPAPQKTTTPIIEQRPTPTHERRGYDVTSKPLSLSDLVHWRNEGEWDKVLGFDLLKLVEKVGNEEKYRRKLEEMRSGREDVCSKNGMDTEKVLSITSEAYRSLLKPDKRSSLFIRRMVNRIFEEWRPPEEVAPENVRAVESLQREYAQYANRFWEWVKQDNLREEIREKTLEIVCFELGVAFSRAERREEAIPFLKEAVKRRGEGTCYHWLGSTLSQLGTKERREEAIPYLEEAVKRRAEGVDYHWLGSTLAQLGKNEDAIPHLREAVRRRGKKIDYEWLADTLLAAGRDKEAMRYLVKARMMGEEEEKPDRLS